MNKIMTPILITIPALLLLAACGEGDADKMQPAAEKQAPVTMAAEDEGSSMAKDTSSMAPVKALEDNGVIYQDEIYKDWPYTEQ